MACWPGAVACPALSSWALEVMVLQGAVRTLPGVRQSVRQPVQRQSLAPRADCCAKRTVIAGSQDSRRHHEPMDAHDESGGTHALHSDARSPRRTCIATHRGRQSRAASHWECAGVSGLCPYLGSSDWLTTCEAAQSWQSAAAEPALVPRRRLVRSPPRGPPPDSNDWSTHAVSPASLSGLRWH